MSATECGWRRAEYPRAATSQNRAELWVRTRDPWSVPLAPRDLELSPLATSILGENGVARFRDFWTYGRGWDFGQGKPLSKTSVFRMEAFLAAFSEFRRTPSLFLTRDGNLMLGWEDAEDCTIELECSFEGYALYLESTDEESHFAVKDLPALVEVLQQVYGNGAPRM